MPSLTPTVVISKELTDASVDKTSLISMMQELGLKDKTINNLTIYIDNNTHFSTRGSTWPRSLSYFRFPKLRAKGKVVRLSSKMMFTGSTKLTINTSLIHEIEHVAQIERKDPRLLAGYLTQLVFITAGLSLGLTDKSGLLIYRILITALTTFTGWQFGYMFSWHEMQARKVSRHFMQNTKIISGI